MRLSGIFQEIGARGLQDLGCLRTQKEGVGTGNFPLESAG